MRSRQPAGAHSILWHGRDADGREVSSGVYIYRLIASSGRDLFVDTKKLVLTELLDGSLRRDLERTQVLYDTVVQRLQEISLVKNYGALIIEVIAAVRPGEQVWPRRLVLLVGGFLGFLVGTAAAFSFEARDRRFRGREDIRRSLRLNEASSCCS